ncbi:MAG: thiamine phosphate synthase [Peptococcaceae bacterium]|nr:thiamine phosphate synthase [Peptococcaceae bacterium]
MKLIYVTEQQRIIGDKRHYFEKLLSGQPDGLIIREKYLTDEQLLAFSEPLVPLAERYQVPLILRGSPEIAKKLGIRQLQLSFPEAMRAPLPSGFDEIGVSVHHLDEAIAAETHGASRVTYGHIFTSPCKPGLPPRGVAALDEIAQACRIPVFAIGGITLDTLPFLLPTKIAGACLMSASMTDPHPETLTTRLRAILEQS